MSYPDKRSFMLYSVSQLATRKVPGHEKPTRRVRYFIYRLKDDGQVPQKVCKHFFLSTLGFFQNNSIIISVMGKKKGKRHATVNKLDLKPLHDHIESFYPTVSRDQREHAPCRRYLPSDIGIKLMYDDFVEKGNHCSYEYYRKAVKSKNISFTKLGEDPCESCLLQEQHVKADHQGEAAANCPQCERWLKHKDSAAESNLHYRSDAERASSKDTSTRSVDLQNVIMLPRMPGVKSSIFTRRIMAYHETFASVGKKTNKKKTISVVWHEGIAGQSDTEITSVYAVALEKERDIKHVVYWVDNCSSQNKNWCLFSSLVSLVNSNTISTDDITLKFFEPGHTLLSVNIFHHGVEQEMKSRPGGVVYDFKDFLSVVGDSNSNKVEVVELRNEDLRNWTDGHSSVKGRKMPKLADLKVVQLRRGSRFMFVKMSHEEEDFTKLDFLQNTFQLNIPTTLRSQDKGIEEAKKKDILTKLGSLMPPTRRLFWSSLSVSNTDEEQ